jgi:asparagine synthase (glutamine-hydrolysing)
MCGIAGMLVRNSRPVEMISDRVTNMLQSIKHRGPDGYGEWQNSLGTLGFGHVRLAIIDLSVTGSQPMISPSERLVITFNGEIYNFIELKHDLMALGVSFRGNSDTEVLLAAIEHWGIESAISRTRGMFALAVWDVPGNVLWLARDSVRDQRVAGGTRGSTIHFSPSCFGLSLSWVRSRS